MKKIKIIFAIGVLFVSFVVVLSSCSKEDNNAPTVTEVNVSPETVATGGSAVVTVTATDPDGDALVYTYIVTGGSVSGNGAMADWMAPDTPGAYSITVSVNDGNGGTATGIGNLTVIQGK